MYSPHDVELAQMIRRLLHDEGYTVAGARRQLAAFVRQRRRAELAGQQRAAPVDLDTRRAPPPTKIEIVREEAVRELGYRKELVGLRQRLHALLGELDRIDAKPARPEYTATIERVVPSSVPVRRR
jgi:DNA-binding transcriptional MerR regulator